MIITVIIFCTVVTGIAGMEDMKKWPVGGKALLYFEVVSTLPADRLWWGTWCNRQRIQY